jgi:hypothetical protein
MKNLLTIFILSLLSCQTQEETINPKCENGLIFQFKSDLPLSTKLYDCELIEDGTEKVIQSFKSMINDNQFVKINDLDKGLKLKLKVKDNISNKVITSNIVESCSEIREVVEIKGFSIPVNEIKGEVKITLLFPCAEIDTKNYLLLNYIHVVK